jgi:hypothetical protein
MSAACRRFARRCDQRSYISSGEQSQHLVANFLNEKLAVDLPGVCRTS